MRVSLENYWHKSSGIRTELWNDPDLKKAHQSHLKYRPRPFLPSELRPGVIWTLRGPRRVGKTLAIKLLIAELIESEKKDPQKIRFISVENLRGKTELEQVLRNLFELNPEYVFIDEVTSIIGWQLIVKKLVDEGALESISLVLSGSSAFDLKKGSERMAGRKGSFESTDRVLLPMDFSEFLKQSGARTPSKNLTDAYLSVGGFPFRVNEWLRCKKNNQSFDPLFGMNILDDVYFHEFLRRKLDRTIALEILHRLSLIQPGAVSYTSIAKSMNLKADTVRRYLDVLGDAYLLATISCYDSAKNRVALKKDKKFIWIDPALCFLANALEQGIKPNTDSVAEQIVGAHLLRLCETRIFEGLSSPRNIYTWKSAAGNELDYLYINRGINFKIPVEVKYQNTISDWDFMSMERSFGKGILVTKELNKDREKSVSKDLATFLLLKKLIP